MKSISAGNVLGLDEWKAVDLLVALPLKIRATNGTVKTGATHLFLIAASGFSFLLWKIR